MRYPTAGKPYHVSLPSHTFQSVGFLDYKFNVVERTSYALRHLVSLGQWLQRLTRRDHGGLRNACVGAPDMATMEPNVQPLPAPPPPWQGAGVGQMQTLVLQG